MPKKSAAKKLRAATKAKPATKRTKKPAVEAFPSRIPIAAVAKWTGISSSKVLGFAAETGLPIANVTDLAKLFRSLFSLRDRLKPTTDSSYTTDEGLICTTYESAAQALRGRLGIGCAKSVQTWISQGMPGKAGHGIARRGYFPIDKMEGWARDNLQVTSKGVDQAKLARMARKDEESIRSLVLKNAEREQKVKAKSGELLPRDIYTSFVTEGLATLQNGLMNLPLVLLRAGFVPKERHTEFQADTQQRIRNLLDDLSSALARGPEKDR